MRDVNTNQVQTNKDNKGQVGTLTKSVSNQGPAFLATSLLTANEDPAFLVMPGNASGDVSKHLMVHSAGTQLGHVLYGLLVHNAKVCSSTESSSSLLCYADK